MYVSKVVIDAYSLCEFICWHLGQHFSGGLKPIACSGHEAPAVIIKLPVTGSPQVNAHLFTCEGKSYSLSVQCTFFFRVVLTTFTTPELGLSN